MKVVVCLDIEYSKRGSRKATLSVWWTQVVGDELRIVEEVVEQVSCIVHCPTNDILMFAPGLPQRSREQYRPSGTTTSSQGFCVWRVSTRGAGRPRLRNTHIWSKTLPISRCSKKQGATQQTSGRPPHYQVSSKNKCLSMTSCNIESPQLSHTEPLIHFCSWLACLNCL